MRILIIDSKKSHSRKIKNILDDAIPSCNAEIKNTGLEGLSEIHKFDFDIVILSDNLPEGQAFEILNLISNSEQRPPIVIISDEENGVLYDDSSLPNDFAIILNDNAFENTIIIAVTEIYKRSLLAQEKQRLELELRQARVNQNIAEIASSGNHKINNPLMTILGNTQLLIRDCNACDEKKIAKLIKIERAAKKIQEITLNLANNIESEIKTVETYSSRT